MEPSDDVDCLAPGAIMAPDAWGHVENEARYRPLDHEALNLAQFIAFDGSRRPNEALGGAAA